MRKTKPRKMNDRGEIGIGTMIVFIATVLVAAIAAGVLIDVSGKLQERSSRTGKEATEQVSSNMGVDSIVGQRNSTSDAGLKDLELYTSLAPGAKEVDLGQVRIQISDGNVLKTLAYNDTASDVDTFDASAVRDADGSFSSALPVMTAGDLVKIHVDLAANSLEFLPREHVQMLLLPEIGAAVSSGFVTPNSYGTSTIISLQ